MQSTLLIENTKEKHLQLKMFCYDSGGILFLTIFTYFCEVRPQERERIHEAWKDQSLDDQTGICEISLPSSSNKKKYKKNSRKQRMKTFIRHRYCMKCAAFVLAFFSCTTNRSKKKLSITYIGSQVLPL